MAGGVSPRGYGALLALATAAFAYVATETLPIGVLPLIAADLDVSASRIGLMVTGYAVVVAVFSVPLAYATKRVSRRRLMVGLLAVFTAATLVSALARDYSTLLASRLVVAVTHALFWAIVTPAAAGMFPARIRGRVTSVVIAGASLGPMLGVPAGTWLGQQTSWRASFLGLAGLASIALGVVFALLPAVPAGQGHAATGSSPDARRYGVVLVTTSLAVAGLFTAYTYTAVFFTDISGFAPATIGLLLLLRGVADFAGITAGGVLSDHDQRLAMLTAVALLAIAHLGLFALARVPLAAAAMLALSGFAMGAATPALGNRVLEVAPGSTDVAAAGQSTAFNVGIAAGSSVGALVLSGFGARSTALAGGLVASAALAVLLVEPVLASDGACTQLRPNRCDRASYRRSEPGGFVPPSDPAIPGPDTSSDRRSGR